MNLAQNLTSCKYFSSFFFGFMFSLHFTSHDENCKLFFLLSFCFNYSRRIFFKRIKFHWGRSWRILSEHIVVCFKSFSESFYAPRVWFIYLRGDEATMSFTFSPCYGPSTFLPAFLYQHIKYEVEDLVEAKQNKNHFSKFLLKESFERGSFKLIYPITSCQLAAKCVNWKMSWWWEKRRLDAEQNHKRS